ncbi:MAG: TRAP transporter large permease subunit [SAR324 cluster bacterium]|nr:TRAP transporter large permease subunit [SAR324 cluster bacterium]
MQNYLIQAADATLGWNFYWPLLGMVLLIILGVRIWAVVGLGSLTMLITTEVLPPTLLGEALFDGVDSFALIAVPLFILTGDVLVRTGLSNKLLDVAEATMGWQRAGLGTSTVLGCGFFACISGSDAADAAAIGRITIDRLTEQGYPKAYACALVAAGSCTGVLIPPSISYIIIGLILGISASTLFLAAAVPGVLILLSVMITNFVINRIKGYEDSRASFSLKHWLGSPHSP